jgi:hypothetical protein
VSFCSKQTFIEVQGAHQVSVNKPIRRTKLRTGTRRVLEWARTHGCPESGERNTSEEEHESEEENESEEV